MISLKTILSAAAWKYKLWLCINTLKYLIIRIYCCRKNVVFCYGSVGDTFTMIRHIKNFMMENPKCVVLGSINYKEVFRIFGITGNSYMGISESWCAAIFNNYWYTRLDRFRPSDKKFINLNINVYENLRKKVIRREITHRDALLKIAPIKNIQSNEKFYPVYSKFDKHQVGEILAKFSLDSQKIILVNPIGYTHKPLSKIKWLNLAKVLENAGYKVIFNVKNNASMPKSNEWNNYENTIEVPAHLLPLLSESVRLCLARPGGAFDISFGYSRVSDVLNIFLKNAKYCEQLSDSYETENFISSIVVEFGRGINFIEIDEEDSMELCAERVLIYLKEGDYQKINNVKKNN